MWAQVIGAVVGGVAGGVVNGMVAYQTNKDRVSAYRQAAKDVKEAAEKYSGQNAYNNMQNLGNQEAANVNRNTLTAGGQMDNAFGTPAMNAADLSNANGTLQGYKLGAGNAKTDMDSKYYRDTALARTAMKQADIDYKAANQTAQTVMNAAGGLADVYKNIKSNNSSKSGDNTSDESQKEGINSIKTSDESQKEGINNESGLPKADIEDCLRQLEVIKYQYKDPSVPGCDDEDHVGFTAQSLQKTMFSDCVNKGPDGILRIDTQKLVSKLPNMLMTLKEELDALRLQNN